MMYENLTCERCDRFFEWKGEFEDYLHRLEELCKDCQVERDNEE